MALLVLLSATSYADISGGIKAGETKYYMTPDSNFTISLIKFNTTTERTEFLINDNRYSLLPYQEVKLKDNTFSFLGGGGNTLKEYSSSFVIKDTVPYACLQTCDETFLVNFTRIVYKDFELCKTDCSKGCGLHKEKKCIGNDLWVTDNCNNNLTLIEKCSNYCNTQCQQCDRICTTNFQSADMCLADTDCENKKCIAGKCSHLQYIIGDNICSQEENCTAPDCSCGSFEGITKNERIPIILLHGFASSPEKLKKLQRELSYSLSYENGGEISLKNNRCLTYNKSAVYIASFYESKTKTERQAQVARIIESAQAKIMNKQEEKVTFSNTFSKAVERVRSCSDSDKVIVIAHSMGGLITRAYLATGSNIKKVEKLVMLGTPNHGGIYGDQTYKIITGVEAKVGDRKELLKDCSDEGLPSITLSLIDGRDTGNECQQLQSSATFSSLLIDETPGIVEYYTIAGNVDGVGDSVVEEKSVALKGAVFNKVVDCDHFALKDPFYCEPAYTEILTALGYTKETVKKRTLAHSLSETFYAIGEFFTGIVSDKK
jgi:uncharacterized alpha/beta hydrolase family protein